MFSQNASVGSGAACPPNTACGFSECVALMNAGFNMDSGALDTTSFGSTTIAAGELPPAANAPLAPPPGELPPPTPEPALVLLVPPAPAPGPTPVPALPTEPPPELGCEPPFGLPVADDPAEDPSALVPETQPNEARASVRSEQRTKFNMEWCLEN